MTFRRQGIRMGSAEFTDEYSRKIADMDKIKNIVNIIKMI